MTQSSPRFQARPEPRSAASLERTFVHETGFREYDARWLMDRDINLRGLVRVGHAFGALLRELDRTHESVVLAHDYRSYSQACAHAVGLGLLRAGLEVVDIGMAVSPMAYFAQYHLGIPALAQITASHNENGWTGIKMGHGLSMTLGPDEMRRLRDLALQEELQVRAGGSYRQESGLREAYLDDLLQDGPLENPRKVVVATGNGTAGHFSVEAIRRLGCEVVPLHQELDWRFPNGTPNPESERFIADLRRVVAREGGVLGLSQDGDGDRLGVVDEKGRTLYSDKVGLLLARWLATKVDQPLFVADVKCTGLLEDSQVLPAPVLWEKTGHSYIKRAVRENHATFGFERSGHFFFRPPFGRGYDDGLLSAIQLLRMLDETGGTLAERADSLPTTWQSPNYQPRVDDARKYAVVEEVRSALSEKATSGGDLAGVPMTRLVTINGVRAECEDGSWMLVRASSNRPSLVVMAESRTGSHRLDELIGVARDLLAGIEGVDPLDPKTAH